MLSVHNNFLALRLAEAVLEGESPKDFLTRHNLQKTRLLNVEPDASNPGYYNIPVFEHPGEGWVNFFKAPENPKPAIKERLQMLLRTRKGYGPGDIFMTPWGRFLVTDVKGLKEI